MSLRELINALTALELEYGPNVPVAQHDDWDFFVVQSVTYEPEYVPDDDSGELPAPAYIAIECGHYQTRVIDIPRGSK